MLLYFSCRIVSCLILLSASTRYKYCLCVLFCCKNNRRRSSRSFSWNWSSNGNINLYSSVTWPTWWHQQHLWVGINCTRNETQRVSCSIRFSFFLRLKSSNVASVAMAINSERHAFEPVQIARNSSYATAYITTAIITTGAIEQSNWISDARLPPPPQKYQIQMSL